MRQNITRRFFLKRAAITTVAVPHLSRADTNLDFKIGQMIMTNFAGLTMRPDVERLIREQHLGGILLFENNFSSATAPKDSLHTLVQDLQSVSSTPLLIAMDQEGGAVNRLKTKYGFPPTYSAHYLGQKNDLDLTKKAAEQIAETLSSMGINHNFAPVVDVEVNPDNPVVQTHRCFSSDPHVVAAHAAEFIKAHREQHIITTLKHFPGHGSSTTDSHKGLTDVTSTWSAEELIPFKKLISSDLADSIMTAHLFNATIDDIYPASLSYKTITELLRQKLGFQGVVISDDLLMGAIKNEYSLEESIRLAINAGNDILLFTTIADNLIPRIKNIIKSFVESGKISQKRIDESYSRISKLKQKIA